MEQCVLRERMKYRPCDMFFKAAFVLLIVLFIWDLVWHEPRSSSCDACYGAGTFGFAATTLQCVAIHRPRSGSADSSSPWARTPRSAGGTGAGVIDPAKVLQFNGYSLKTFEDVWRCLNTWKRWDWYWIQRFGVHRISMNFYLRMFVSLKLWCEGLCSARFTRAWSKAVDFPDADAERLLQNACNTLILGARCQIQIADDSRW